jgi:hypothetical protein
MHLVAAHVHFKLRIEVRDLRSRDLVHRYGNPESAASTIRQLVASHLGYAGAPDAQRAPHFPDGTDAYRLAGNWNGRYGGTHVTDRDRNSRVRCLVAPSPGNIRIDDDALLTDVEAPTHTAKHLNAPLDFLRLTLCYALRENRLRLGDPQDVACAVWQKERRPARSNSLNPGSTPNAFCDFSVRSGASSTLRISRIDCTTVPGAIA